MTLAAVVALSSGAFGFTSVSADRALSVEVVDDEEAFLGIEEGPLDRCGGNQRLLTVHNRFGTAIDATVTVTKTEGVQVMSVSGPDDAIDPGESGDVIVQLKPDREAGSDGGDGSLTVRVSASGNGVEASATRTYATNCAPSNAPETATPTATATATAAEDG